MVDLFDFAGAVDAFGRTYALSKVRELYILNTATATDAIVTIVFAAGTTTQWVSMIGGTDKDIAIPITPLGRFHLLAPSAAALAVADSTNHTLLLANAGAGQAIVTVIVTGSQ